MNQARGPEEVGDIEFREERAERAKSTCSKVWKVWEDRSPGFEIVGAGKGVALHPRSTSNKVVPTCHPLPKISALFVL